jgi:hypothetical protein
VNEGFIMLEKPIDQITKTDIDELVANQVVEKKTLEYKRDLPGTSDGERKEFLADATSFANTAGGHIIYGIEESNGGVPIPPAGLEDVDRDGVKLRIDQMLRDGVRPRVSGAQTHFVEGFTRGPVLFLRVPRSYQQPHMVVFSGSKKFYARATNGKYEMDVDELRRAFIGSESLSERIRGFRADRVAKIVAGDAPVPLTDNTGFILHIIPFDAFARDLGQPIISDRSIGQDFPPMPVHVGMGYNARFNMDGFVTFSQSTYCQIYRNGIIEATLMDTRDSDGQREYIAPRDVHVTEAATEYLSKLHRANVSPPILIAVSVTGVKGAFLPHGSSPLSLRAGPIDRDHLFLPDIVIERYDVDLPSLLRPTWDVFWNAGGYSRSPNYTNEGRWNPNLR